MHTHIHSSLYAYMHINKYTYVYNIRNLLLYVHFNTIHCKHKPEVHTSMNMDKSYKHNYTHITSIKHHLKLPAKHLRSTSKAC